MVDIG